MMDEFDYRDVALSNRKRVTVWLWNILTLTVLLAIVCMVAVFVIIFINPYSSLNLFPPPTLPVANTMPTLTPTAIQALPATWTATVTATATPTLTPTKTNTPIPSATPTLQFTATQTPTGTLAIVELPFDVGMGSPVALASLTFHPEAGCNWLGVAGQALDMSGAPLTTGLVIKLGGVLGGVEKDFTGLTGTAPQYGEAGYEIVLASKPIASTQTLWVQLLDPAGLSLSPKIYFDTFESCDQNLIMINFQQLR